MRGTWLGCLAAVLLLSVDCAAEPPAVATIHVDAERKLGPVNRLLFGHNVEAADGTGIFPSGLQKSAIRTGSGFWDADARRPQPDVARLLGPLRVGSLRYPGGCLAHNFDWKMTIGPVEARGDWRFGLDEFLALCEAYGAEPVITVADYAGTPRDAADLVEYLNAPVTAEHPWAVKRAANGRAEPWGVRWFELGNESDHGNHDTVPHRRYSPEDYARYFRDTAAAMRAVDPAVQLGIVLQPGITVDAEWNHGVLTAAGADADFAVVHFYAPGKRPAPGNRVTGESLMQACMAAGGEFEQLIREYRAAIRDWAGKALPLAVTEFNLGAHTVDGHAYRFTYGAALMSADMLRVFLDAGDDVAMAHYWQAVNGYFGFLRHRPGEAPALRAMYPLLELWGERFGDERVAARVESPTRGYDGYYGLRPAGVPPRLERETVRAAEPRLSPISGPGFTGSDSSGVYLLTLQAAAKEMYPKLVTVAAPTSEACDFHLRFRARFRGDAPLAKATLGLGLSDARGWDATGHAVAADGVEASAEWKDYELTLRGIPGTAAVDIVARIQPRGEAIAGVLELDDVSVEMVASQVLPPYPLVTAAAGVSDDGATLHVIAFNKGDRPMPVRLALESGAASAARAWHVTGPSLTAMDGVEATPAAAIALDDPRLVDLTLPPASMTAIELTLAP